MLVPVTDSRGLSHSEPFAISRRLTMLDRRSRPQRISHMHTLHHWKATLTACTPYQKAPDLHWNNRDFGKILIHVVFNVLHKVGCGLFALQSRRTISNQENLPCLHEMESLCNKLFVSIKRVTGAVDCGVRLLCRLLSDCCQLLLLAAADQVDHLRPGSCPSVPDIP